MYIYIYICKTPTLQRNNGQHGCFCKPTVSGATNSGRAVPGRAGHSGSKAPGFNLSRMSAYDSPAHASSHRCPADGPLVSVSLEKSRQVVCLGAHF